MENYEIEYKFLILNKKISPFIRELNDIFGLKHIAKVEQYYFQIGNGYFKRVRHNEYLDGVMVENYIFTCDLPNKIEDYKYTFKQGKGKKRIEKEFEIDKEKYEKIKRSSICGIEKLRFIFNGKDKIKEPIIDIYQKLNLNIIEFELKKDLDWIKEIEYLKERYYLLDVTNCEQFKNQNLAEILK